MKDALPNLTASIDRVKAIADDINAHASDALKNPAIHARHETTLCAATVILSGFLESFLRDIAEEMITDICNRGVPFDKLPSKIRITHYWEGAQHLREMARQDKKEDPILMAKALDAARRLASVGSTQLPYELLWEAFAETQANPGHEQIGEFLKRFHIDQPMPTLADSMGITPNNLLLRLTSFMEIRNECAHTGSATKVPTASDLQEYCKLVEDIGEGIVMVFQNALATPLYVAAQAGTPPTIQP